MKWIASVAMLGFVLCGCSMAPATVITLTPEHLLGLVAVPGITGTPMLAQSNPAIDVPGQTPIVVQVSPVKYDLDFQPIIDALEGPLLTLVAALIAGLAGYTRLWFQKRGIEINAAHMEEFEKATTNLAGGLIARGFVKLDANGMIVHLNNEKLRDFVQDGVNRAAPAIKRWKLTDEQARAIVERGIIEKLPQVAPPATTPVMSAGGPSMNFSKP